MGYYLENQLITPFPKFNKNPEIDIWVLRSPAPSASVYPARDFKSSLNVSSSSKVLLMYWKIFEQPANKSYLVKKYID